MLADPHICPSCRSPLNGPGCPGCGLRLDHPLAQELFAAMQKADALIAQLRELRGAQRVPGFTPPASLQTAPPQATPWTAAPPVSPPVTPAPAATSASSTSPTPPTPATWSTEWAPQPFPRQDLAAPTAWTPPPPLSLQQPGEGSGFKFTVPGLLLALGALMLCVGAITFLALTWGWLGYSGRTGILIAAAIAAAVGTGLARRHTLRMTAEAVAAVASVLIALIPAGASSAGWLGTGHVPQIVTVGALIVCILGIAATHYAGHTPGTPLFVPQIAAVIAAPVAAVAILVWAGDHIATGTLCALVFGVLLAAAGRRLDQYPVFIAGLTLTGLAWLVEVGIGAARLTDAAPGLTWAGLAPMLLVIGVAGVIASPLSTSYGRWLGPRFDNLIPTWLRVTAGALGLWLTGYTLLAPWVTGLMFVMGLVTFGAVVSALLARRLTPATVAGQIGRWSATAAAGVIGLATFSWGVPVLGRIAYRIIQARGAQPVSWGSQWDPSFLDDHLEPLMPLFSLVAGAAVWLAWRTSTPVRQARVLQPAPVAALVAGITWPVMVWYPWLWLVVVVLAAFSLIAGWAATYPRSHWLSPTGRFTLPPLLAATVWSACTVAGLDLDVVALVTLAVAMATTLAVLLLHARRHDPTTWLLIGDGTLVALIATALGTPSSGWLSIDLAVIAVGLATFAILLTDGILGVLSALLGLSALWLRLAEVGVTTLEAYSLPCAGVLLLFGGWVFWRRPASTSLVTLGPGLLVAVVPTGVVALVSDNGHRSLWLLAGAVVLVCIGLFRRWQAPFVIGVLTAAIMAIRSLIPVVAQIPTTVLLVAGGVILLACGFQWERLARGGRSAWTQLTELR